MQATVVNPASARREAAADSSLLGAVTAAVASATEGEWRVVPDAESPPAWIRVLHAGGRPREQGWKLHVSAAVPSAAAVLGRALPVLLSGGASFKVAASLHALDRLNSGDAGVPQIGKFLTVYPNDDAQAVRLAVALDQATRGLRGPAVPSDRRLAPESLVHYRYGGFESRHVQLRYGLVVPAIRSPDGELVPDERLPRYHAPAWAADPFAAAGVTVEPRPRGPLLADRFLPVSTLRSTPRGSIRLAVDLDEPRNCVVKTASRDAYVGADGRDARDRLRHEAAVLARLTPDPRFPTPFALVEDGGELYLAMEEVEGETFEEHVRHRLAWGRLPSGGQVVAWGEELAAALGELHARGFVYRDVKSPNVMVAPDGRLRLLDFEIAHEVGSGVPPFDLGTRGYVSPQQAARGHPAVTDDVYGLGALLYYAATGAEPSHAPREFTLLDRPVRAMNPAIGPELAAVIARCLDPDPAHRFPSMAAVSAALAGVGAATVPPAPFGADPGGHGPEAARRYGEMARRLGDTLCRTARRLPDGRGAGWTSAHQVAGPQSRDINTGSAGAVLALAALVSEHGVPEHARLLADAAHWLAAAPPLEGPYLPGLYVGDAGVGAALLRAGQVLADAPLLQAAAERGRRVAAAPHASPDLFNGTAGRLRFHLLLWDETGDREHLEDARRAGEALLAGAESAGRDELRWTIPPGYDDLSGLAYLGYAHGAAGIADALLDLHDATGEERFLAAACGAARWLGRQAVPVLDDDSGLSWPALEGGPPAGAFWCHGATGVGLFFAHLAATGARPEAAEVAARAARAVARGSRFVGPVQCHGLAGNIEFLLDMFQATGDRAYHGEAESLARLLEAFGVERDGGLVWSAESPSTFSPDYLVGYAGVATCLLRLSAPERLAHQLSRRGFRSVPPAPQRRGGARP
jgi:tRNA A-37 threonylcarbamoyl transferase component Bud32